MALSAAQIWHRIGGFNALPDWHPAVEKSELEEGGTVRRPSLAGGGGAIKVRESAQGGSEIEWWSEFSPSGALEAEAVLAIQGND